MSGTQKASRTRLVRVTVRVCVRVFARVSARVPVLSMSPTVLSFVISFLSCTYDGKPELFEIFSDDIK